MFASSKGAFGFVLLFCVVSFLCLFPVSLSLRLPFVLTWRKFCYQMGTRSPFRVSFHHPLSFSLCLSPLSLPHSCGLHLFICIHMDLCLWTFLSFLLGFQLGHLLFFPVHENNVINSRYRLNNTCGSQILQSAYIFFLHLICEIKHMTWTLMKPMKHFSKWSSRFQK